VFENSFGQWRSAKVPRAKKKDMNCHAASPAVPAIKLVPGSPRKGSAGYFKKPVYQKATDFTREGIEK
jgi:hypothetical protein